MRDPPSGRVPEQGPDWFLVATEACGDGTPDLFCSPKVLGYIGIYRRKKYVRGSTRGPRGWGRAPLPRGAPVAPPTYFFLPYIPIYPKNFGEHNRSGVPPPEASVATKNQSRPVPAPCRMGESLSGGHIHHPSALHDEDGVVLPRG